MQKVFRNLYIETYRNFDRDIDNELYNIIKNDIKYIVNLTECDQLNSYHRISLLCNKIKCKDLFNDRDLIRIKKIPPLDRSNDEINLRFKLREEIRDLPIICDPSHIAGKAALVGDNAQTAMDINLDGLMIETHHNPSAALSDAEQQVTPKELNSIMNNLVLRDTKLRDEEFKGRLLNFRTQIDNFDTKIIELLDNRKQVVEHIANFKNENKLTIFQIERWFEILNTRKENANLLGVDEQMVEEIFALIHKYSILTQTKIMRK